MREKVDYIICWLYNLSNKQKNVISIWTLWLRTKDVYINFYRYAFLLTLPAVLVYLIAYFIIIKAPKPDDTAHKSQPSIQKPSDEEEKPLLQDTDIGREFFMFSNFLKEWVL